MYAGSIYSWVYIMWFNSWICWSIWSYMNHFSSNSEPWALYLTVIFIESNVWTRCADKVTKSSTKKSWFKYSNSSFIWLWFILLNYPGPDCLRCTMPTNILHPPRTITQLFWPTRLPASRMDTSISLRLIFGNIQNTIHVYMEAFAWFSMIN